MDQDQPGALSLPVSRWFAAALACGSLFLAAPDAGAQVPDPTAATGAPAMATTSAGPTTATAAPTTTPAAAPPVQTPREAREQGNVWIVVAATVAMIAALVAIAVIQRRRDPTGPALSAGRSSAATRPAPGGAKAPAKPAPGSKPVGGAVKAKPKPDDAAKPGHRRSVKKPGVERKPRRR